MGKSNWYAQSADFDHHPQVMEAGWHAAQLFLLFLRISKRFRLDGLIPPKYLGVDFLSRYWGGPPDFPYETAMKRLCVSHGLMVKNEDGSLQIDGWRRWVPSEEPGSSTERVRRFREMKRGETACNDRNAIVEYSRVEEIKENQRLLSVEPTDSPPALNLAIQERPKRDEADEAVEIWNRLTAGKLPSVQKLNPGRRKKIRETLADVPLESWPSAIANLLRWPWGTNTDPRSTGWLATLDWFCGVQKDSRVRNALRCAEGALGGAGSLRDYKRIVAQDTSQWTEEELKRGARQVKL